MRFRILGPLEVWNEQGPLDLGSREQRLVLGALLLEAGGTVPLDLLAGALWGSELPSDACNRVLTILDGLRGLLGDHASLRASGAGARLDVASEDVDRTTLLDSAALARSAVERRDWDEVVRLAASALELWRGPLLADLDGIHGARSEARRLGERRAELREAEITGLLGLGRLDEAEERAAALRHDEPLREHGCWLQMLALHRAGRSSDALDVYRDHARMLRDEFGLEPAPEVRDLRIAILRRAPDLLGWPEISAQAPVRAHATAAPAAANPAAPGRPSAGPAFVGRAEERSTVRRLAAGANDGLVRWVVLTGPPGIGKTRLAEEALAEAHTRGFTTVRANCPEDDGGGPLWWPVRQLVRELGGDPDVVLSTGRAVDADTARFAVYERLDELIHAAAAHPVLILIDDLQWMDAASARWFTHLAGSVYSGRLTVILTLRDGEEDEQVARLLASVARHPGTVHLGLTSMAPQEVGELVSLVAGEAVSDGEATRIERLTGGNPFFVTEFARLPQEQRAAGRVPLAVSAVLRRRLAGIPPAVLEVLRAAAVAGDPMDVDLIAAVLETERAAVADRLGEAADAHLVTASGASYTFAHDLLRREVLAGVPAQRRALLHARIAAALDAGTVGGSDLLGRRASHLLAAAPLADPLDVLHACRAAARDADNRWQSETAAAWWLAAIEAFDRVPGHRPSDARRDDLLVNRVASLARAGRRSEVMSVVDTALADAVRGGRTTSVARLAGTLLRTAGAWPWTFGTDPGPLPARLAAVEPLVAHDPAAQARVLSALAAGRFDDGTDAPDRMSARALDIAERLEDDEVLADALLGRALAFAGLASRAEESIRLLDRLLQLQHRLHRGDHVLAHILLTMALFTVGDLAGVEEHYRLGVAGSDALRLPISRVQLRWMEATMAVWHGRFDRAERLIDRAYELHRQTELYVPRVHAFAVMALRWEQGRIREWEPLPVDDQAGSPLAVAAQAMSAGRFDVADRILDTELARPTQDRWTTHAELTLLAHILADVGDTKHARLVLDRLQPFAGFIANAGRAGVVGPVALAIARLHVLLDEPERARAPLTQAMRLAERTDGAGSVVRCRLLEARLDDADGAVFASIALDAEALGMRQVAAEAKQHAFVAAS